MFDLSCMPSNDGNATTMASVARGKGSGKVGPLKKLDGNPLERLIIGLREQETIVVCGLPMWERIELLDVLAKSISKDRKVIVLEDRAEPEPSLREDVLPQNHVVLNYNVPGESGVSLADIAKTALSMAGDYLIVPNLRYRDIEVFQRYIAHEFEGIIVAVDAFVEEEAVRSIADILVKIVSDKSAPLGIGSVWARPGADLLEAIPAQDAGPHFVISTAGQISGASASALDVDGNDIRRIRQFLPLVRQSADDLAARLTSNGNAFTELVRDITRYRNAISRPEAEIAWGLVWGLGVRLGPVSL